MGYYCDVKTEPSIRYIQVAEGEEDAAFCVVNTSQTLEYANVVNNAFASGFFSVSWVEITVQNGCFFLNNRYNDTRTAYALNCASDLYEKATTNAPLSHIWRSNMQRNWKIHAKREDRIVSLHISHTFHSKLKEESAVNLCKARTTDKELFYVISKGLCAEDICLVLHQYSTLHFSGPILLISLFTVGHGNACVQMKLQFKEIIGESARLLNPFPIHQIQIKCCLEAENIAMQILNSLWLRCTKSEIPNCAYE